MSLAATLALVACGGGSGDVEVLTVFSLAADLDLVQPLGPPAPVDVGTAEAAPWLLGGFSTAETWSDGRSVTWSLGVASHLAFWSPTSQPWRLRFRASALVHPEQREQVVAVVVNEREVGRTSVRPGFADYELGLPSVVVRGGWNTVELRYAWTHRPISRTTGRPGLRPLAVAWDAFALSPDVGAPASRLRLDTEGRVALPAGNGAAVCLELEPDDRLRWRGLERERGVAGASPSPPLELRVSARNAEGRVGRSAASALEGGRGELRLEPISEKGVTCLELRTRGGARAADLEVVRRRPVAPAPASAARVAAGAGTFRPNILLYLVDTLRADHLGCYGYERPTSPRLDAFARESTLFESAFAQSNWTRPSCTSLLSGWSPARHGVRIDSERVGRQVPLLAEALRASGYATVAWSTNLNVSEQTGLARGFDELTLLTREGEDPAAVVSARFLDWLNARDVDRPFFAYLHPRDLHEDYRPGPPFLGRFGGSLDTPANTKAAMERYLAARPGVSPASLRQGFIDLYDEEILQNDAAFGEVLDGLERAGLTDETLVVFVSDHGEAFLEHGLYSHNDSRHVEVLHVPLVVRWPPTEETAEVVPRGQRIGRLVDHLDVAATVRAAAGLADDPELLGRNLRRMATDRLGALPERAILSSVHSGWSLRRGDWHLVHAVGTMGTPGLVLYDLGRDPSERDDRSDDWPELAHHLHWQLYELVRREGERAVPPQAVAWSREERAKLRALGYAN